MPDVDLTLAFAVILLVPPILVGIAWLVWFRSQRPHPLSGVLFSCVSDFSPAPPTS
jgi:ABC-type Fe3+ transport system permease subunit